MSHQGRSYPSCLHNYAELRHPSTPRSADIIFLQSSSTKTNDSVRCLGEKYNSYSEGNVPVSRPWEAYRSRPRGPRLAALEARRYSASVKMRGIAPGLINCRRAKWTKTS
ncbi:hypothetical protein J6590_003457 [Homalodisca vitripennis]|nr:hypothetical protein J6590_003457 [Homalodisca vitripennis]